MGEAETGLPSAGKACHIRGLARFTLGIDEPRGYGAAACKGRIRNMTEKIVPHFHNTPGVAVIEIGAQEFMCVGETPPFDHPHVFLDMGDATEIICPYCSTLYRHDPTLDPHAARPAECALRELAV
jgi:uncharacterized Zn-finger protein